MTTIVYAQDVIAADRRVMAGGWRMSTTTKLATVGAWVVAYTGELAPGAAMARAFDPDAPDGNFGVKVESEDVRVIAATAGRVVVFERGGWFEADAEMFHAWGSGGPPAMAALLMGADAARAVEIAAQVDPNTGDGVETIDLRALAAKARGGKRKKVSVDGGTGKIRAL